MLETLEDLKNALVAGYDPERVILFGSRARGDAREDSDYDLLVVKETSARGVERRLAVRRILAERTVAIDVEVFTPAELRYLYSRGAPLITEIVTTGKVIYMRDVSAGWLEDTEQELRSAEHLLQGRLHKAACLHAQQAVEKAFKTVVLERGGKLQRTHDITTLRRQAEILGFVSTLSIDDAEFLSSVYSGRYPSEEGLLPQGPPTEADAERAVGAARHVVQEAREMLASKHR